MKGFDAGTAGLILGLIALILTVGHIVYVQANYHRISRLEYAFKSYCVGDRKTEICAELDLPLTLEKFKK